jgi:DNA-binding SARP family transcriptional activator/TolB-like protein/Tfp pilus assembly protein PilF
LTLRFAREAGVPLDVKKTKKVNSRRNTDPPKELLLQLLGPARITVFGDEIEGFPRKNFALLAYLAVRDQTHVARDTICGLLWPDSADEQARASLRQALTGIRKALGSADGAVISNVDSVRIDPARVSTDVARFLEGVDARTILELAETARLYRGDLLEGFSSISPEYDRWLDAERGALRSHSIGMLLRLADAYEAEKRFEEMISTSKTLLNLDSLQEHVHRRLMRAYRAQGRHDAALRQFENLREILLDQLGVEPEKPTLELFQAIRKDRNHGGVLQPLIQSIPGSPQSSTKRIPEGPVAPARPSIAVLRFRGMPAGSEAELLGEGISEDVTIDLSRESDLLVVSRQSAFQLDENKLSAREIGDQLGIRFYLSGAVRIFGKQLRVTAHLVSCDTGHEIWAERFDRELEDFFQIQTEIARVVSATSVGRIAADIVEKDISKKPDNLEGYQLVLKGVSELHKFSEEAYRDAIVMFERAIERSPDYGRAYGWLALSKLYLRWNIDASIDLQDISVIAERAVVLDPNDPKGHCALAMCNFIHRQFDRAEFCFQSALRANPNDELVLTEYGRFLMYLDRPEDGLQRIRDAMRVNPYFPAWFWSIQGRCLHTLGRYEEAIEVFERVRNPPFYIHAYLAACYAKVGQSAKAEQARMALYEVRPDFDLASFKSIFPYKNRATADLLFEGFELAGLS